MSSLLHPLFQKNHRVHHHILSALLLSLAGVHSFLGVNYLLAASQAAPTDGVPKSTNSTLSEISVSDSPSRLPSLFSTKKSTVYISKNGYGKIQTIDTNGVVISGVNCGIDCSHRYPRNTSISLQAIPADGYVFSEWKNDCKGRSNICTLSMNTSRKLAGVVFKKILSPIT